MSMPQINYSDPVLEKIEELTRKVPGWAKKCAEKMNLKPSTIHAIRRGERGITNGRPDELLEVLTELYAERERRIKKLIA